MATFLVTNNNDNGNGSLRQAIEDANNTRGADIIEFEAQLSSQTISLTTGELTIADDLTINGLGSENLTIDGINNDRVFKVDDGDRFTLIDVSLHDITITNGFAKNKPGFENSGGGIFSEENLTITNSNVINNVTSSNGGGIYAARGTVEIIDSEVANNTSKFNGGGINFDNADDINIDNSIITNNTSNSNGGGISIYGGFAASINIDDTAISNNVSLIGGGIYTRGADDTTISNSTISGNFATGERFSTGGGGGGIYSNGSTNTINNSTISGNTSNLGGGGIFNSENYSNLIINNSTITDNTVRRKRSGAGIYQAGERTTPGGQYYGTIEITSTIIAGNFLDKDLAISGGDFTSEGNNLIGSSNLVLLPEDIVGTPDNPIDPQLGELEDNGGGTQTIALLENSPAIDAGSNPLNLVTDQRGEGFDRTEGEAIDIGAFEVQNSDEPEPMDNVINGTKSFIITTDEGTDVIRDFNLGIDLIGLSDGITFNDLTFNSQNILFNGKIIAKLNDIDPESLTEADFILI